jgi:hypothetical protein
MLFAIRFFLSDSVIVFQSSSLWPTSQGPHHVASVLITTSFYITPPSSLIKVPATSIEELVEPGIP